MELAALAMTIGMLLTAASADTTEALLGNGGFESWKASRPGPQGLVSGWRLGDPPQVPADWSLNTAYPGQLLVGPSASAPGQPHSGAHFARIVAQAKGTHLFQMCRGMRPGGWYRVSAWTRGGPVSLCCYEYGTAKFLGTTTVAQRAAANVDWSLTTGYYRAPTGEYKGSAVALCVAPGQSADVDDVSLEPLPVVEVPPGAADVTLETEALRLCLSPTGVVRQLQAKPAGDDYSVGPAPLPVLTAVRQGVTVPLHAISRSGDLLQAQFLDPEVQATLRVASGKRHLRFELVSVQPADVEQIELSFPVRRLATVAPALNATYDQRFGICLFGTTENTFQRLTSRGGDVVSLAAVCTRKHGLAGARFALVAAAGGEFPAAIMETERAAGLPCPMLEGRWARDSQPVRRSYLFIVDATEANIDRTIDYARLGHFGMIIMLKDNWLATHGHYTINTRNFPDGLESLKRVVGKIHAAGMGAGVHVFGPSISANDAYVTPKPDDRLAAVACPPLVEAVDARATTLTLAGQPNLPPKTPRSASSPGNFLRLGDEIIRYGDVELGPPFRFVKCQRGALGTAAAAHAAGAPVRGLVSLWSYFLVDPQSTLADELVQNFGRVFNECDFDMVYFDASDGVNDAYLDRWFYLNKLHLGFYRQFRKDVLYQTSNGPGSNLTWHLVPRSASADGHGDIKGYLDQRWPGILNMEANLTRPDVGWYYMYTDVRPDQIEYVCAKVLGIDGSISIETSQAALEKHAFGRRMIEMVGRYEECRLAGFFPPAVRALLREPGQDFRLCGDESAWKLYRASYETPRVVEYLNGRDNVWSIRHDGPLPGSVAVEITRGARSIPTADYDHPAAVTVETFDDAQPYRAAESVPPAQRQTVGVQQTFTISTQAAKIGARAASWQVKNAGNHGGWATVQRTLEPPLNLAGQQALALWVHGDGRGGTLRIQLRDVKGRLATWLVPLNFHGWRLCSYALAEAKAVDWSKIAGLVFTVQGLPAGVAVDVGLDDLKALAEVHAAGDLVSPVLEINGRRVPLAVRLAPGQGLTADQPAGAKFWPGGMQPAQSVTLENAALTLKPGENRITLSADTSAGYPGDVSVVVSRLVPLEPIAP